MRRFEALGQRPSEQLEVPTLARKILFYAGRITKSKGNDRLVAQETFFSSGIET